MLVSPKETTIDPILHKLFQKAYKSLIPTDKARGEILHQARFYLLKKKENSIKIVEIREESMNLQIKYLTML